MTEISQKDGFNILEALDINKKNPATTDKTKLSTDEKKEDKQKINEKKNNDNDGNEDEGNDKEEEDPPSETEPRYPVTTRGRRRCHRSTQQPLSCPATSVLNEV